MRTATLERLLETFASTFREWHYFAGGLAIGFLLGAEYARRVFRGGRFA